LHELPVLLPEADATFNPLRTNHTEENIVEILYQRLFASLIARGRVNVGRRLPHESSGASPATAPSTRGYGTGTVNACGIQKVTPGIDDLPSGHRAKLF